MRPIHESDRVRLAPASTGSTSGRCRRPGEGDAGVTRASRQTLDSDTCLARAAVELYALPRAGVASPVHSSCQHIARLVCERICPHRGPSSRHRSNSSLFSGRLESSGTRPPRRCFSLSWFAGSIRRSASCAPADSCETRGPTTRLSSASTKERAQHRRLLATMASESCRGSAAGSRQRSRR